MFWGHDGDLFATSVIKRDMGDVKTHFWNLGRPYKCLLCIKIHIYIYTTKISTSALNRIKCCKYCVNILALKKSHMVPVLSPSREFSLFWDGTGTGIGKNWSRKKVPVPVLEKFGPGKKYRFRYRKKLVPEKSTGTGIGINWSRYCRITGNSRSFYILISSCTFRHWENEMSL